MTPTLLQEHTMTSYINQTIARQQVTELVAYAERSRQRRELREARREARAARREERRARSGASNSISRWPHQVGYSAAR
jgi:hypothetical protein